MGENSMRVVRLHDPDSTYVPPAGPGVCVLSGQTEGEFLDTGRVIPFHEPYGLFHVPMVESMGRAVGMVPRSEYDEMMEVFQGTLEDLVEAKDEIEKLKAAMEGLAYMKEAVS